MLRALHREKAASRPVKIIQFGEGNFLRAFVDWQIDILNERKGLDAGVVIVRPKTRSEMPLLDTQDGLYTTLLRGIDEAGEPVRQFRKITCVQHEVDLEFAFDEFLALARNPDVRFIFSNTTEAGIAVNDTDRFDDRPPSTFPGKMTRLLYERFKHFAGAPEKGVILLPCELIDHNGKALKAAVRHFAELWALERGFIEWLDAHCTFCTTLVDRIVPGYPRDEIAAIEAELGYHDQFLVTAEYFHLFVIEGPAFVGDELKLADSGLNIRIVDDATPYKKRKVGILNGGHTTMVPVAILAGLKAVGEAVDDPDVGNFLLRALNDEIIPVLPLPRDQLNAFAADVLRRFRNPFIYHRLESIALNSWSKYEARVLPQLLAYTDKFGTLPARLVTALAATMVLYRGGKITLQDDEAILTWFADAWKRVDTGEWQLADLVKTWLANGDVWKGRDLNTVPHLTNAVMASIARIQVDGIRSELKAIAGKAPAAV
jgi:Mannitol-1-phosphate/altronate dehydrogenases